MNKKHCQALVIAGYSPMQVEHLEEEGAALQPFYALASLAGKDEFRLSSPSLGAVSVASFLDSHGLPARVVDFYIDETIPWENADIIGISSTFMSADNVVEIARAAKARCPDGIVILGGPLAWSISPSSILEGIPEIDIIAMKEGEATFLDVVRSLRSGGSLDSVEGIVYRNSDGVRQTPDRSALDLRDIPFPDWSLLDLRWDRRMPVVPVETSRGCPYDCAICSEVSYWGKPVRYRGIPDVIDELSSNVSHFDVRTFRFADSCFSAPAQRTGQLCDAIRDRFSEADNGIKWSAYARVNNLDRQLLSKMAKSGCVALDIGAESGDQAILQGMNRKYSLEKMVEACNIAKDLGIIVNFNFVVGFPGENQESIDNTIEAIERAAPDTYTGFVLYLAPNTRLWEARERYGIEGEGLSWRHGTMDTQEAQQALERIFEEVTSINLLPAGEHISIYMTSLGFSPQEIRSFFDTLNSLARKDHDGSVEREVLKVWRRMEQYW
jgi:p-methyltransferase